MCYTLFYAQSSPELHIEFYKALDQPLRIPGLNTIANRPLLYIHVIIAFSIVVHREYCKDCNRHGRPRSFNETSRSTNTKSIWFSQGLPRSLQSSHVPDRAFHAMRAAPWTTPRLMTAQRGASSDVRGPRAHSSPGQWVAKGCPARPQADDQKVLRSKAKRKAWRICRAATMSTDMISRLMNFLSPLRMSCFGYPVTFRTLLTLKGMSSDLLGKLSGRSLKVSLSFSDPSVQNQS